ncbi:MAG: Crp/Fnr family transcriptional regulator [Burkholderiales bacterium]
MLKHPIPIGDFLRSLPLFKEFDEGALARFATGIKAIDVPKGSVFLRRGDPCTGFHVVVYGQVKLSLQTPRGDEKVVELLTRGHTFGEAPMFLDELYRYTAECLADTKLLHVAKSAVLSELERDPAFARRIIASLSLRLSHLIDDLEGCTLRSGTQRVISYLLHQVPAGEHHERTAITFPAQKSIIASHLNLTHEHFSRILHDLVTAGMIEVRGPVVRILDAAELRVRAV